MDPSSKMTAPHPEQRPASLVSQLIALIHHERLSPGDGFPSELVLAERFGVARSSIREAMKALEALGILETAAGKRARIGRIDGQVMALLVDHAVQTMQVTIQQTLDLRRTMEIRTARIAAVRRSERELADILSALDRLHKSQGNMAEQVAADIDFHCSIAAASGNPLYLMMVESFDLVMRRTIPPGWVSRGSDEARKTILDLHDAIAAAIEQGDPVGAEKAMAAHFDNSVQALVAAGYC